MTEPTESLGERIKARRAAKAQEHLHASRAAAQDWAKSYIDARIAEFAALNNLKAPPPLQ